jgi:hypothetical protein
MKASSPTLTPIPNSNGRIQYVKASNHPKHDAALKQLLIDVSHFHNEWKPEAIDGEGMVLSEEWRSPSPSTNFDPAKWTPTHPGGHIDPSNFDGMDTSF